MRTIHGGSNSGTPSREKAVRGQGMPSASALAVARRLLSVYSSAAVEGATTAPDGSCDRQATAATTAASAMGRTRSTSGAFAMSHRRKSGCESHGSG